MGIRNENLEIFVNQAHLGKLKRSMSWFESFKAFWGGHTFKFSQNDGTLTKNHSSDFNMCSSPYMDQFFCVQIFCFSCMRLSTDETVKNFSKHQKWNQFRMLGKLDFLSHWFESQWKFYQINSGAKLKRRFSFMAGTFFVLNFNK